ncbi:hypothetical protein [Streptomyces hirsutus]|uniref:hypothetical protein n=1 Tax=Streptomyces hirsutus TaxID=35620 RepID=UPI00339EB7A4
MRKGLVLLGVVVALSVSACGSSNQEADGEEIAGTPSATSEAAASPSVTSEATASPSVLEARESVGSVRLADELKFGQSYDFKRDSEIDRTVSEQRGNVTVLEYRPNVAPAAERAQDLYDLDGSFSWSSLKVRICHDGSDVDAGDDDFVSISAWPWALELSDDSLVSPFEEDLIGFPKPLYPTDDEDLYAGACRTGHIVFAVPDGQRVTRVLYIRQSSLPVAWADQ